MLDTSSKDSVALNIKKNIKNIIHKQQHKMIINNHIPELAWSSSTNRNKSKIKRTKEDGERKAGNCLGEPAVFEIGDRMKRSWSSEQRSNTGN